MKKPTVLFLSLFSIFVVIQSSPLFEDEEKGRGKILQSYFFYVTTLGNSFLYQLFHCYKFIIQTKLHSNYIRWQHILFFAPCPFFNQRSPYFTIFQLKIISRSYICRSYFCTPPMLKISVLRGQYRKLQFKTEKAYVRGLVGGAFRGRPFSNSFCFTLLVFVVL